MNGDEIKLAFKGDLSNVERVVWRVLIVVCLALDGLLSL